MKRWFIVGIVAAVAGLVALSVSRIVTRVTPGSSQPATIGQVGGATTFAARNSGRAVTSLPAGVVSGDIVVSYVESYPFTSITCEAGGIKALDVANGAHTRLVGCWKVAGRDEPGPSASIVPPTEVSMVTLAFRGIDTYDPVAAAVGSAGVVSPSVAVEGPGGLLVLGEGSDAWQAVGRSPSGATIGASVNNAANSQVAAATKRTNAAGPSGAMVWATAPGSVAAAAGSIVLRAAPSHSNATSGLRGSESPDMPTSAPPAAGTTPPSPSTAAQRSSPPTAPSSPPALVCGDTSLLGGPQVPPAGAVVVAAGDNSSVDWSHPGSTFWFAAGTHTLGSSPLGQILAAAGTTFVGAPGATIDGQGVNYSAFTTKAPGVTVKYLTIQHFNSFADQGVVNHDSGDGWTISHNTITGNHGAATMIGNDNTVTDNCLSNNGQYGFDAYSAAGGPQGVVLDHNEITGNNADDLEAKKPGCGCTGGGKFWQTVDATVTNNYVHHNHSVGLWADGDNVGMDAEGNYISDNDAEGMVYEVSYNAAIRKNTFVRNNLVKGPRIDGFPGAALYVSESGGDSRVRTSRGYTTVDISGNVFTNNWDGVVLWENADRFCGNGEAQFCTLVNPSAANISTCVAGRIALDPLYSDCRWKTQNVMVHDNVFTIDKASIRGCASARTCGDQGLFSNFGTYPAFSPYRATVIEEGITFKQNNHFSQNTYNGDWHFVVHGGDTVVDFKSWQSQPYNQDIASTTR